MKQYAVVILFCFFVGCATSARTPYPYQQWSTPVRPAPGGCVNIAGVYDLSRTEYASGPQSTITSGVDIMKRITVVFLGKQAFRGTQLTEAHAIPSQRLEISQADCTQVTTTLFAEKELIGSKTFSVYAETDNSGSGVLSAEGEVISSYPGILGKDNSPMQFFLLPSNDLVIMDGYEKVGVSLLLPLIPRVYKAVVWYKVPRVQSGGSK